MPPFRFCRLLPIALLLHVGWKSLAADTPKPTQELEATLDLATRTLAFVEKSAPQPRLAAELKAVREQATRVAADPKANFAELLNQVRSLRRKILFTHPLLGFDKLLINKNHPTTYSPPGSASAAFGAPRQNCQGPEVSCSSRSPSPLYPVSFTDRIRLVEGTLEKSISKIFGDSIDLLAP